MNTIQHGENVLVQIDKMPEGNVAKSNLIIIGHSETGHHHVLSSTVEMESIETADGLHITITVEATLSHRKTQDKHDTLPVRPGIYLVRHKTEYNPITKVLDRVFD